MTGKRSRLALAIAITSSLTLALVFAGSAAASGRPFTTSLAGANERPTLGDPDATGTARVWINPGTETVCWSITVQNVDPAIAAAHIHFAPAGSPGDIVVPLNPYTGGCHGITRDLALKIIRDPSAYYVNVHNATYPGGAARGQLSRTP
jgi:hypothetical protein